MDVHARCHIHSYNDPSMLMVMTCGVCRLTLNANIATPPLFALHDRNKQTLSVYPVHSNPYSSVVCTTEQLPTLVVPFTFTMPCQALHTSPPAPLTQPELEGGFSLGLIKHLARFGQTTDVPHLHLLASLGQLAIGVTQRQLMDFKLF